MAHVRKLLVVAALGAVAPVSAHPTARDALDSDCPYARAAAEAAMGGQTTVTIDTEVPDGSLFSSRHETPIFLP